MVTLYENADEGDLTYNWADGRKSCVQISPAMRLAAPIQVCVCVGGGGCAQVQVMEMQVSPEVMNPVPWPAAVGHCRHTALYALLKGTVLGQANEQHSNW